MMETSAETDAIPSTEHDGDTLRIDAKRWRLGVGAVSTLVFIAYSIGAFQLPMGSAESPGAGLFPAGIGIAGVLVSVIVVIEALRGRPEAETLPRGKEGRQVLVFVGSLVVAIVALPWLGMYLVAPLYSAGVAWYLGERPRWRGAVIAGLIALGASAAFVELLEVRLPLGFW